MLNHDKRLISQPADAHLFFKRLQFAACGLSKFQVVWRHAGDDGDLVRVWVQAQGEVDGAGKVGRSRYADDARVGHVPGDLRLGYGEKYDGHLRE